MTLKQISVLTDKQKEVIIDLWTCLCGKADRTPEITREWHQDARESLSQAFETLFCECERRRCGAIVPCGDGKDVCVQEARMHASNGDPGDPAEYEWHCNECIEKSEDYDG